MTSPFDPNTFAQMTFNRVGSTEVVLIPVGEHPFEIAGTEVASWESQSKGTSGAKLNVRLKAIDADGALKELTGRDENFTRFEFFLDLTDDMGLDFGKGKNVILNRLLVAVGIQDGQPWSFDSFVGRKVVGKVKHGVSNKGLPFAECEAVRAA